MCLVGSAKAGVIGSGLLGNTIGGEIGGWQGFQAGLFGTVARVIILAHSFVRGRSLGAILEDAARAVSMVSTVSEEPSCPSLVMALP